MKNICDFYFERQKYMRVQTFLDWLATDFFVLEHDVQIWLLFVAGMIIIWIVVAMWVTRL